MEQSPVVLATRYLMREWEKRHGVATPPMELTRAVTQVVLAVGYTKKKVDELIVSYEKNMKGAE